jgi:hypothetical protein
MNLADHRIAADAAKMRRDLACAEAFAPELSQHFDAFVVPIHVHAP